MTRSLVHRVIAGASAAGLALGGLAVGGAAQATPTAAQPMFSYADGWRVERHVRELADVTGDGRADIVGFGDAGLWVAHARPDGTFTTPVLRVRNFGAAQGWSTTGHVRTVADLDGDGRADLVGFGDAGVSVAYAQADGTFTAPALKVRDFGAAQGWSTTRHVRTAATVGADSAAADLVGFGDAGVLAASGRTNRTFTAPARLSDSFGYDRGWRVEKHPRLLADVYGVTQHEIVGFGDAGTWISRWSPVGWFMGPPRLEIGDFGYDQGWRTDRHTRILGDLNGDRMKDVVGFGHGGTWVSYAGGDGRFSAAALKVPEFGYAQGWRTNLNPRTLADLNGDGLQDIVGFGYEGMYAAHGRTDNTFDAPFLLSGDYGVGLGWDERLPRLLGDVNGDGRDDVVGFGASRTVVTLS
ncbi:VCBS repeat-containing protein [uncultured Kocuria sp.]|uniref:FG-GAP repeat domain-containing protein n=1 Tax=uncultured Kocuria sp. TaxID=259305 RepID=UPI00260B94D7|nr:VCBS repeat-containing protein [uncultured Kocuria sp.]